jgi:hypothetical protein
LVYGRTVASGPSRYGSSSVIIFLWISRRGIQYRFITAVVLVCRRGVWPGLERRGRSCGQDTAFSGGPPLFIHTSPSPRRALAGSCSQHRAVCPAGRQKLPGPPPERRIPKAHNTTPRRPGACWSRGISGRWASRPSPLRTFARMRCRANRPGARPAGGHGRKMRRTTSRRANQDAGFRPRLTHDADPANQMGKKQRPDSGI